MTNRCCRSAESRMRRRLAQPPAMLRLPRRGWLLEEPTMEALESRQLLTAVNIYSVSHPVEVRPDTSEQLVRVSAYDSEDRDFDVDVYASADQTLDAADVRIGTSTFLHDFPHYPIDIYPNDTVVPGDYHIIVVAQVPDVPDSRAVVVTATTMRVVWEFRGMDGFFGARPLVLAHPGARVIFELIGPGLGTVTKNQDGSFNVALQGTTRDSDVSIRGILEHGAASLGTITVDGSLGSLKMPTVNLRGSLSVSGYLGRFEARDVIGTPGVGLPITISGQGDEATFKFRNVANASITTVNGIARLTLASKWSDSDSLPDLISATYLNSLTVHGNFAAGLRLFASRAPGNKPTLGTAVIDGQAGTNAWWVNGGADQILVGSTSSTFSASFGGSINAFRVLLNNFRGVIAADNIHAITIARTVDTGSFLAGADLGMDGRLGGTGLDADVFHLGNLGSVSVGYKVLRGLFAAGVDPVNGVFNDGDDRRGRQITFGGFFFTKIRSIHIADTADADTRFLADRIGLPTMINGSNIITQNDLRFHAREFGAPRVQWTSTGQLTGELRFYFSDSGFVAFDSINDTTLTITGPHGYAASLRLVSARPPVNSIGADFSFMAPPPGGTWDPSDNGPYTISVRDGGFTDLNGNGVVGKVLVTLTLAL